jgi:hypothetical protein
MDLTMPTLRRHSTTFYDYTRRNLMEEFNSVEHENIFEDLEEQIEIIIDEMLEDMSDNESETSEIYEAMDYEYDTEEDVIVTEIRPWDVDEVDEI